MKILSPLLLLPILLLPGCQPKEVTSAKMYIKQNEWERAIEQLEIAVKDNPNNAEAQFLLGEAYGRTGRYAEMNEAFKACAHNSSEFTEQIAAERERHWIDKYHAGILSFDRRQFDKAEGYFRTAVAIDPTRYEAHKRLALTYVSTGQVDNAFFIYNRLLEKRPDDIDILMALGSLHYSQGTYEQTIELLEKVLTVEPGHRDALANLALAYDSLGQKDRALFWFEKAVAANPLDTDLIFLLGVHHYQRQSYGKAIEMFERVLELKADEFEAISNIGNAYLSMAEDMRIALGQSQGMKHTPEEIQRMKARVLINYKQAIPYLERAIRLRPENADLWRNLGVAYFQTSEEKKGEEAFLKSEELKRQSFDEED